MGYIMAFECEGALSMQIKTPAVPSLRVYHVRKHCPNPFKLLTTQFTPPANAYLPQRSVGVVAWPACGEVYCGTGE